jgi:hypothetical protein
MCTAPASSRRGSTGSGAPPGDWNFAPVAVRQYINLDYGGPPDHHRR